MRLKSFQAVISVVFSGGARDVDAVYQDGSFILAAVTPEEVVEVLARLGGTTVVAVQDAARAAAEEPAKKAAEPKKGAEAKKKDAAPPPPAADAKAGAPATAAVTSAPKPAPVAGDDVNEAWGFGPEVPGEVLSAANLSPILRFLMKQPEPGQKPSAQAPGLKTKDELVAACRSLRERAGESCAPLHRIDPATLPDRIDRFLAATS